MNVIRSVIGSTLMVVGTLTLSQQAMADHPNSLRIAEFTHPLVERVQAHYEVNEKLGRAWVLLEVQEDNDEENFYFKRVAVPGMSFDADTGQVVLNKNGQTTVCAQLEQRRILGLRHNRIAHTGECRIDTQTKTVNVDDGFFINPRQVHVATLTVENGVAIN